MPSSDKKEEELVKDNRKEDDIYESLRNNEEGVLLESKEHIVKLIWKNNASSYL